MLRDYETFAILMCDEDIDEKELKDIIDKIVLRTHIGYNIAKICSATSEITAYVLYNPDKQYVFEMARNKKLIIIWKDKDFFGCISFKDNTKGDIVYYLEESDNNGEKIEGEIIKPNVKPQYIGKLLMLIGSKALDENEPYLYEPFCYYKNIKKQ